ncbi:hypothetical protein [Synechococcus sp. GFB01]|uniref:hypothetical protein n=1 Tax=Synechococcus sp. GFB01 TaxID=1662190 RepID=UPI00128AE208|nr:hypothetical protein [Synechococcus sp. GFB01]
MLWAIQNEPSLINNQRSPVIKPSIQIDLTLGLGLGGDNGPDCHLNGGIGRDPAEIGTTQGYLISQHDIAVSCDSEVPKHCTESRNHEGRSKEVGILDTADHKRIRGIE